MLLKLKTLTPFLNLVAPVFPNSKARGPTEIRFSKRWGNNLLSLSLLDHQRCRRDQIRYCWMAGGGGGGYHDEVRVWWDLNRCPVPAGVDPRRVRQCIESALEKQIGRRCAVSIVAIGNLEYTSCDLLEKISSSGIILIHIALGRKDMYGFLKDWSDNATNAHRHIMIISDALLCHRDLFQRYRFYATYVAYPKGARLFTHPNTLQLLSYQFQAFAKEFVWETLLSDNLDETLLLSDNNNNTCDDDEEPLYSCNICSFDSQVCDEFITHFKSEEHRNMLYDTVGSSRGKIVHFCKVCNYPAYNEYNLFLHNQSEEHNRKAQEEEDCESSKTNPELDLLYYERNKKESLSMSLKLNTPHFPNLAVPSLFPNSNPKEPSSEIQFSKRWGNANAADLLSLSLLDHQRCRRDQIRGGGGDHHDVVEARVWWDLNTCPVPAGVDPRRVRQCIESALEKQIRRRCAVSIYATGNLEYTSSDLLEKISSSGIILTHAPCGKNDLYELLDDWSDDELKNPYPPSYIMMISSDYDMLNPERFRCDGFTNFVAYPKDARLAAPIDKLKLLALRFAEVFAKQFVWETLFSKYLGETLLLSDNNTCDEKPLCICNICNDVYDACDEFITHLKSEEHKRNQLFETVVDQYGKRKYFCQVCNCHLHGEDIILLHNHEHNCNLVEKQAQEEEDCERRKTNPELDFFCERNKKQSL